MPDLDQIKQEKQGAGRAQAVWQDQVGNPAGRPHGNRDSRRGITWLHGTTTSWTRPISLRLRHSLGKAAGAISEDLAPDLGVLRLIPVEDLFAGPEQHVAIGADVGEGGAQIFEAVRRAHNVGVYHQRHDAGRARRVTV